MVLFDWPSRKTYREEGRKALLEDLLEGAVVRMPDGREFRVTEIHESNDGVIKDDNEEDEEG